MSSWAEFRADVPPLAATVRAAFAVRKHATMATVRRDGSPRISGTEVDFADDGQVYVATMGGTRRGDDLRRDPRLALHGPTEDAPEDDPPSWAGDAKIDGRAVEVEPDRFRIDIDQVVHTKVDASGEALQITIWRPGQGTTVIHRADPPE